VAFRGVRGAAALRAKADTWPDGGRRRASVPRPRDRPLATAQPSACPEIDCVRDLLPSRVVAAAERRARAIGLGADRVLICADAMTEDAYLTVLAASLGTSYEPLERISRADCPLDDDQLVQAAAAGLLPVCEAGEIVWIIAPRCLTARRLASQSQPAWLQTFRLTSSERLLRFVARHTQKALGRRAADGLRRSRPLFSNAPRRHGAKRIAALGFVPLAVTILSLLSAPAIEALATLLCSVFLGAAGLRLLSVAFARQTPRSSTRNADRELPIYTIICALYREARRPCRRRPMRRRRRGSVRGSGNARAGTKAGCAHVNGFHFAIISIAWLRPNAGQRSVSQRCRNKKFA